MLLLCFLCLHCVVTWCAKVGEDSQTSIASGDDNADAPGVLAIMDQPPYQQAQAQRIENSKKKTMTSMEAKNFISGILQKSGITSEALSVRPTIAKRKAESSSRVVYCIGEESTSFQRCFPPKVYPKTSTTNKLPGMSEKDMSILSEALVGSPKFSKKSLQSTFNNGKKQQAAKASSSLQPVQKEPKPVDTKAVCTKAKYTKAKYTKKHSKKHSKNAGCAKAVCTSSTKKKRVSILDGLTKLQITERKNFASRCYKAVQKEMFTKTGSAAFALDQAKLAHKEAAAAYLEICKNEAKTAKDVD